MDPWDRGQISLEISTAAFFHVSSEAREVAEKVYKVQKSREGFEPVPQILINYDIDIPRIDYGLMSNGGTSRLTSTRLEMFGKMRRIAILQSQCSYFICDFSSELAGYLRFEWDPNMWKSLEEVIILAQRKNVGTVNEYRDRQSMYSTTWYRPAALELWWDDAGEALAGSTSAYG